MNYFIRPRRCSGLPHAINPYNGADRAVIGQNLLHLSATLFSSEFGPPTGSSEAHRFVFTALLCIGRPPDNERYAVEV